MYKGYEANTNNLKKTVNEKCDDIEEVAKRIKIDVPNTIEKSLSSIKEIDTRLNNKISVLNSIIDKLSESEMAKIADDIKADTVALAQTERSLKSTMLVINGQAKTEEYRKAAREEKDSLARQMLYMAAINGSNEKTPVLNEYIEDQEKQIKAKITEKSPKFDEAWEILNNLAGVCDAALSRGSVQDIRNTQKVQERLVSIGDSIKEAQQAPQTARLREIREQLEQQQGDDGWKRCGDWIAELEGASFSAELEDDKETLIAEIRNKRAYMTPFAEALEIPDVAEDTAWQEWLTHFSDRLKAKGNETPEQALAEIDEAASFLEEAKKHEETNDIMEGIMSTAKICVALDWNNRARQFNSQEEDKKTLAAATALLAEAEAFSDSSLSEIVSGSKGKLHDCIMEMAIKSCDCNAAALKDAGLENSLPSDVSLQLLSNALSQYVQLLHQLESGRANYPSYGKLRTNLVTKINGLNDVISGKRTVAVVPDLQTDLRANYRHYAEWNIDKAEGLYNEAEDIADDYFKTRANEECVWRYKEAWFKLMTIHPDELRSVDPALAERHTGLKAKIENAWPDYKDNLTEATGKVKHIQDNPKIPRTYSDNIGPLSLPMYDY